MTVREQGRTGDLTVFSFLFQFFLSYRLPLKIHSACVYLNPPEDCIYYQCPRCQTTLDREFVSYCDRCGQRLDWHGYKNATQHRPGEHTEP